MLFQGTIFLTAEEICDFQFENEFLFQIFIWSNEITSLKTVKITERSIECVMEFGISLELVQVEITDNIVIQRGETSSSI